MAWRQLGAILDRSVHLVVHNARPLAVCMAPAILVNCGLIALEPRTSVEEIIKLSDNPGALTQIELYLTFFAVAVVIGGIVTWICAAAVMPAARSIVMAQAPHPATCLRAAFQRAPSLVVIQLVTATPAVLPALASLLIYYQLYRIIGDIRLLDPASLDIRLAVLPYLNFLTIALVLVALPLAEVAVAAIMLDDYAPVRALRLALQTCFSRAGIKRYFALWVAITVLIVLEAALAVGLQNVARAAMVPTAIPQTADKLFAAAVTVYTSFVVALAWMSGYLAPERAEIAPSLL